jgi:glycosyltransferase involved in cell wall biosynthesis
MNSIKVSIVMGTYNRIEFLKPTIDSIRKEIEILNQSSEIIIIDGGSTDGTINWLTQQKDIISIIQHNRGSWKKKEIKRRSWGYFMNLGFKISQGKYICMLSDDCLVVPNSIINGVNQFEKQLIEGEKIGGIAFFWREYPFQSNSKYWVGRTFGNIFINHGLYLNQALKDVNYIDEDNYFFYHADGDLSLKIIEKGYKILQADHSYIEHYSHANTIVRSSNLSKQKEDLQTYKKKWMHLATNDQIKIGDAIYKEYDDQFHTLHIFSNYNSKIKPLAFLKKIIKKIIYFTKNPKYYYNKLLNLRFIQSISKKNKENSSNIFSSIEIIKNSNKLNNQFFNKELKDIREDILNKYKFKLKDTTDRILIHVPDDLHSPAGFSYFNSLYQSIKYMGVTVEVFRSTDDLDILLKYFKPTLFLSSDHESYLSQFDWISILNYKDNNSLKVGLTASLEEYGNTPLLNRLESYSKGKVDFFYSFRTSEYISLRNEYDLFQKYNYKILNIEFACNPLYHFPVDNDIKEFDFVFLASNNPDKIDRVSRYLTKIVKNYNGVIAGPWWPFTKDFRMNPDQDRYIYSMAKIGLNLSIPEQIQFPCELNERTYILAACGIIQLIDNPSILFNRFSKESLYHSSNEIEYFKNFETILKNYQDLDYIRSNAFKEVYQKHTTFHRLEKFLTELRSI